MYYNNPFGDNYPFIEAPLNSGSNKIYDIYITYYDPSLNYALPLKLTNISASTCTIKDANDKLLYTGSLSTSNWGPDYTIMQVDTEDISIAIIRDSSLSEEVVFDRPDICLRCVYTQPKHITSISVNNTKLSESIDLTYGYNTDYSISTEGDTIRPYNAITLTAEVGLGLGTVKNKCDSVDKYIYEINNQKPDANGTVYIYADDCIAISQTSKEAIRVKDECTPCCLCSEFSEVAAYLDNLINKYYNYGAIIETTRDCAAELSENIKCSKNKKVYCPVRVYIDTTWPRNVVITAEIRNVTPKIMHNLNVTVTCDCATELIKHKTTRTMSTTTVSCGFKETEAQDQDNSEKVKISEENGNTWVIHWESHDLQPGDTVWCSVQARNGYKTEKGDEYITVNMLADYELKDAQCSYDCFNPIRLDYKPDPIPEELLERTGDRPIIIDADTESAMIKGGTAFEDYTEDREDRVRAYDEVYKKCKKLKDEDNSYEDEDDSERI